VSDRRFQSVSHFVSPPEAARVNAAPVPIATIAVSL
jgi:hypothetical protein